VVHRARPTRTRTAISVFDTPSAGSNMIRPLRETGRRGREWSFQAWLRSRVVHGDRDGLSSVRTGVPPHQVSTN
jgi:hypothetical protein